MSGPCWSNLSAMRIALVLPVLLISGMLVGQAQQPPAGSAPPPVTDADIKKWMTTLSNWGRWGKEDQKGTLNLITPAVRKQALALVKEGTSVSLAHTVDKDKALELQAEGKKVLFYLVGRKGRPVIARLFPGQIIEQYETTGIRDIGFDQAHEISAKVMELFEAGAFDVAHLFYSKFRSALLQIATGQQLIPVPAPAEAPASAAKRPRGRASR